MVVKKDPDTKTFLFETLVPKLEEWCSKITIYVPIGIVSANCTTELIQASNTAGSVNAIDVLNALPEVVTLSANLPQLPSDLR